MDLNRAPRVNDEVQETIKDMFEYHKWDDEKTKKGQEVRSALMEAVRIIVMCVPPCPDRTVAIRKLREARMDCNSAITHGGKY